MSNKPHSVVMLSTSYPLRGRSACGAFVGRLAEELGKHCHMTVVCPDDCSSLPHEATEHIQLKPYRYAPRSWQRLGQSAGGVLAAQRDNPALIVLMPIFLLCMVGALLRHGRRTDLIHANWAICGALAVATRVIHRKPVLVTLRGDDVTLAGRSRLHRFLLKVTVRGAAQLVCVSRQMADDLQAEFPHAALGIRTIYNGVAEGFHRVGPVKPQQSGSETCTLLYVGSLIERKGVADLIAALAQSKSNLRLRIAGDGPLRAELESSAQTAEIQHRVEFLGEVEPEAVPDLLAECDALVLPSISEGRPNVILEAMAARRPVIATRIPGVLETLSDPESAWLVPAGDSQALARALDAAASSPPERQRRANAAHTALTQSVASWGACAEQYLLAYRRAIAIEKS